jgi:hypothetical protein
MEEKRQQEIRRNDRRMFRVLIPILIYLTILAIMKYYHG